MNTNGITANGAANMRSFQTVSPARAAPRQHKIAGFTVITKKLPILKAEPIEQMTQALGIAPPEMIFGDNLVKIEYGDLWSISFDAFDALDAVDKTGEKRLKVAYSADWQASRQDKHDLQEVKPFDWSYTPQNYRGNAKGQEMKMNEAAQIPLELLKRPDPILFFDDVVLYESELDDNGIAMLSVKVRVMPARMLLLARFFMRLDGVVIRVKDTRVYVDFGSRHIIREHLEKEAEYESVKQKLSRTRREEDITAIFRDANQMAEVLPVVKRVIDEVVLPPLAGAG